MRNVADLDCDFFVQGRMSSIDPSLLFFQQQGQEAEPAQAETEQIEPVLQNAAQAERNQVLAELLYQLNPPQAEDSESPLIPDSLLSYYLQRSGFQTDDLAVTRLIGLATQKFMSDIVGDAYQYARTRSAGSGGNAGRPSKEDDGAEGTVKGKKKAAEKEREKARTVLTMEDLNSALEEHGIQANRAPYYL